MGAVGHGQSWERCLWRQEAQMCARPTWTRFISARVVAQFSILEPIVTREHRTAPQREVLPHLRVSDSAFARRLTPSRWQSIAQFVRV
jgi:hypothetical protein